MEFSANCVLKLWHMQIDRGNKCLTLGHVDAAQTAYQLALNESRRLMGLSWRNQNLARPASAGLVISVINLADCLIAKHETTTAESLLLDHLDQFGRIVNNSSHPLALRFHCARAIAQLLDQTQRRIRLDPGQNASSCSRVELTRQQAVAFWQQSATH